MTTATLRPLPSPLPAPSAANLDALERVLTDLVAEHRSLLELTGEHRRALTEADTGSLKRVLESQGAVFHRIARLEMQRLTLVGSMTGGLAAATERRSDGATKVGGITISALTSRAPEAQRSRLATVTKSLRDILDALHKEHRALREAAEALSDHMEGLMRQVYRSLSHAGTYVRSGTIDTSVQIVSTLDLQS